MKQPGHILILMFLMMFAFLWARDDIQQNNYRKAVAFEKSGEYSKAESLYVNLTTANPDNFNYFTRYKNILILERKFDLLLPVMEQRADKRKYDKYLKLELAVLYYALGDIPKAEKKFRSVFQDSSRSMRNSYAVSVYQNMIEYGRGSDFHEVVNMLRKITGDSQLLVRYNFVTSLRYRNWDAAVNEISLILNTNPDNLKYVRLDLFRYDPSSVLYQRIIDELSGGKNPAGKILLSEVYIHLSDYPSAFDVLSHDGSDKNMQEAMSAFADRMFKQHEFVISRQAAEWVEKNTDDNNKKISMALLSAMSREQLFYELAREPALVVAPFSSRFTNLRFRSFNSDQAALIASAYSDFDSLSVFPGAMGKMAKIRHAGISYKIYQDFDKALEEYTALVNETGTDMRREVLTEISELYLAKSEYEKAVTFLQHAADDFHLMVHEEDRLLPQLFFASVMAGNMDSLTQTAMGLLALLPKDDALYNDVLSFTGFINMIARDTLNREDWLEGEHYLLQNKPEQALAMFENLVSKNSSAMGLYALRYLDCIHVLHDKVSEGLFWDKYYQALLETDMADYFMIRYAEYYEKMQKYEIAIEIFEKYLLSYKESMYYETIREYIRQQYSTGAP